MNTQQAIQILINGVEIANQKGAFSLKDSKIIAEAVEIFTKKPENSVEVPKKEKESKKK